MGHHGGEVTTVGKSLTYGSPRKGKDKGGYTEGIGRCPLQRQQRNTAPPLFGGWGLDLTRKDFSMQKQLQPIDYSAVLPVKGVTENKHLGHLNRIRLKKTNVFVAKNGKVMYRYPDGRCVPVKVQSAKESFRNLNDKSREGLHIRTAQYDGIDVTAKEAYVNRRVAGLI